jgi:hypothetical protein
MVIELHILYVYYQYDTYNNSHTDYLVMYLIYIFVRNEFLFPLRATHLRSP